MTYNLLGNEADARRFYQLHLARNLQIIEKSDVLSYMVILGSRRKYHASLSVSQLMFNRQIFSIKIDENSFIRLLRSYEIADNSYVDDNEQSIPRDGLVMYCTVQPLDERKATFELIDQFNSHIQSVLKKQEYEISLKDTSGSDESSRNGFNTISKYKSCLHSAIVKIYRKLDVDSKESDKIDSLKEILRQLAIPLHMIIESRSGYHVMFINDQIPQASHKPFYDFCTQNTHWMTLENTNAMTVIPGTYQGGFLTKLIDLSEWS